MLGVVERGAGKPLGSRHPRRGQCRNRASVEPHAKELRCSRPERIQVAHRPRAATGSRARRRRRRAARARIARILRASWPGQSSAPASRGPLRHADHATILPRRPGAAAEARCCGAVNGVLPRARRHDIRLSAMALAFLDLELGSEQATTKRRGTCSAPSMPRSRTPGQTPCCSSTPASTPRASAPSRRNALSMARR